MPTSEGDICISEISANLLTFREAKQNCMTEQDGSYLLNAKSINESVSNLNKIVGNLSVEIWLGLEYNQGKFLQI